MRIHLRYIVKIFKLYSKIVNGPKSAKRSGSRMARFPGLGRCIVKRILFTVGLLVGVVAIAFLLFRVVIPDPARVWAGPRASQQTLEALTTRFHLNAPLYLQFYYYLNDLVHG